MVHAGTRAEKLGSAAAAEGVRSHVVLGQAGADGDGLDDSAERGVRHAFSGMVDEQGFLSGIPDQVRSHRPDIAFEISEGGGSDRHNTFLAALAHDHGSPVSEVNALYVKTQHLSYPQAAGIEELQHGAVAVAFGRVRAHVVKQAPHLRMLQHAA